MRILYYESYVKKYFVIGFKMRKFRQDKQSPKALLIIGVIRNVSSYKDV